MRPSTDRQAGFMLVEILAALLVTAALVAVVLPYAARLIARWQTGQGAAIEADAWMQVVARLSDDVGQAVPVHDPRQPGALALRVEPKRVEFIRPALGSAGAGGLDRVSYRIERVPGGEKLVRTAAPLEAERGGSEVAMIEGPYLFAFTAVSRDGARGPWANRNDLPVRLDLAVTGGGGPLRALPAPLALPLGARATVAAVVPLLRQRAP